MPQKSSLVAWFEEVSRGDVARVGGKNASLGEMVRALGGTGVKVPDGFATTAEAYWSFVNANGLTRAITGALAERRAGRASLAEAGAAGNEIPNTELLNNLISELKELRNNSK